MEVHLGSIGGLYYGVLISQEAADELIHVLKQWEARRRRAWAQWKVEAPPPTKQMKLDDSALTKRIRVYDCGSCYWGDDEETRPGDSWPTYYATELARQDLDAAERTRLENERDEHKHDLIYGDGDAMTEVNVLISARIKFENAFEQLIAFASTRKVTFRPLLRHIMSFLAPSVDGVAVDGVSAVHLTPIAPYVYQEDLDKWNFLLGVGSCFEKQLEQTFVVQRRPRLDEESSLGEYAVGLGQLSPRPQEAKILEKATTILFKDIPFHRRMEPDMDDVTLGYVGWNLVGQTFYG